MGATTAGPPTRPPARIDRLLDQPPFDRATWGVIVVDSSGHILYERNPDRLLVPASCNKLLVTTTALALLGPSRRLTTSVYGTGRTGRIERGVLDGDLVVYGRGDPTFSSRCYDVDHLPGACDSLWTGIDVLADGLVKSGLKRVTGAIVGDGSCFEPHLTHDGWEQYDLNWWYAAPVSGLAFNDNSVDVKERPGTALETPAVVTFEPDLHHFTFDNRSRTSPAGSPRTLEFYRRPGTMSLWSEGDIPIDDAGLVEYFALPDPNLYFAQALRARLEQQGVQVAGSTLSTTDSLRYRASRQMTPLASRASRPVSEIIFPILNTSQNLFAEMLLKTVGKERGRAGSWEEGLRVERRFLVDSVGVDSSAFATVDGSGLGRSNLVTARALTQILRYARGRATADAFLRAMPRSGQPGSLRRRFVGTPLEGRVVAKTGSVERVHSLAGYIERPHGGNLTFAIIANNYAGASGPMVAQIDSVVVEMGR